MFECTHTWVEVAPKHLISQAFSRRLHYTTPLAGLWDFFQPFLNKPLLKRGSKEQLQFHPTKTVETLSIYTQNFYKVYSTTSLYTYTIHNYTTKAFTSSSKEVGLIEDCMRMKLWVFFCLRIFSLANCFFANVELVVDV